MSKYETEIAVLAKTKPETSLVQAGLSYTR